MADYSLGVIAYQCLAGKVPFGAKTAADLAVEHRTQDPPPLPAELSEEARALEPVVRRALEKRPAARFQSMEDFANHLGLESREEPSEERSLLDRLRGR
jgi:serine/threonine-protein kinase